MRILLIGATGQIGYALGQHLACTSHDITLLLRNPHGLAFPDNFHVIQAAEFSETIFLKALEKMDCVIYGVGLPEQFMFDPRVFQRVNRDLFRTFLDALQQSGLRRLIYLSTYKVFQPVEGVVRESHPVADMRGMTPYFKAMTEAYLTVLEYARKLNLTLTTIHPSAVYGGLDTGGGFTAFVENLLQGRFWRAPAIVRGSFPLVHVDSLANAIVLALGTPGSYLISDQMTSLREIAQTLRGLSGSYIPPMISPGMARASMTTLEAAAVLLRTPPIMSRVQLEYIQRSPEPLTVSARKELSWKPMALRAGLEKYLQVRGHLPAGH